MHVNLSVDAIILPALRIIRAEHQVTQAMVDELCGQAHVIPLGREQLWAKGLFWGFEYEYNISLHLLIPQIEHFVRILMKSRDIRTTTLNSMGIETENGLSTLLEKQAELKTLLGENLLFEFQALLADPVGPNLRNEVAHGLWEADGSLDNYSVYFWWLCLRLVMNSIHLRQ